MTDFKVGDKVRVLSETDAHSYTVGDIAEVVGTAFNDDPCLYLCRPSDGLRQYLLPHEVEPFTEKDPAIGYDEGLTPFKPDAVYVGQMGASIMPVSWLHAEPEAPFHLDQAQRLLGELIAGKFHEPDDKDALETIIHHLDSELVSRS